MNFKLYDEDWKKEAGMGIGIVIVTALISFGIHTVLTLRNDMKDMKEQVALLTKDYAKQASELKQAIKDRDYNKMAEDTLTDEVKKLNAENDALKDKVAKYEEKESQRKKEIAKKEKTFEIGTIRESDEGSIVTLISKLIAEKPADYGIKITAVNEALALERAKDYAKTMGFIRKSADDSTDNELLINKQYDDNIAVIPVKHSSNTVNGFAFYVKHNGIFPENPAYTFMLSEKQNESAQKLINEFELRYASFENTDEEKEEIEVATFNVAPAQPMTKTTNTAEPKSAVKYYKLGCLGDVPEIIPSIHIDGVKALSSAPQQ